MKYVPPPSQKTGVSVLYSLFDKVFTPNEQREFWRKWGSFGGIRGKEARREGVGRWLGGRYVMLFPCFFVFWLSLFFCAIYFILIMIWSVESCVEEDIEGMSSVNLLAILMSSFIFLSFLLPFHFLRIASLFLKNQFVEKKKESALDVHLTGVHEYCF